MTFRQCEMIRGNLSKIAASFLLFVLNAGVMESMGAEILEEVRAGRLGRDDAASHWKKLFASYQHFNQHHRLRRLDDLDVNELSWENLNKFPILSRMRRLSREEPRGVNLRHHSSTTHQTKRSHEKSQKDKRLNNAYRMCHFKLCNLGKRGQF